MKREGTEADAPHETREEASLVGRSRVDHSFESWLYDVAGTSQPVQRDLHTLSAGTMVADGRLQVLRRLGAGGMGVVYEALDVERSARVALKTLRTMNAQALYRFKHEFRALAEILHPRLVPLYELVADAEGQLWFFTMELIEDGVDLMTWVRGASGEDDHGTSIARARTVGSEAPAPRAGAASMAPTVLQPLRTMPGRKLAADERGAVAELARAARSAGASAPPDYELVRASFAQLAEGVRALHAAGRLHRDLKPANVFVRGSTGEVVLLDFGLVAALDAPRSGAGGDTLSLSPPADDPLDPGVERPSGVAPASGSAHAYYATQAGSVVGTIAYMAPEQALAQPLTVASDWYAVGVMLYEALTGTLPYAGADLNIAMAKQAMDPVPPSARVPGTPLDLDRLCMELLRRDASQRPDAEDVLARLGGATTPSDHQDLTRSAVFVGRAQQLGALASAFELSSRGTTIARVHGRSGAGKSSLLARFLDELAARPDTLVLSGRCYEQEFIPFKAVDSLMDRLTHYLLRCTPEVAAGLLPRDAALLARLFPVLGRALPHAARGLDVGDLHAVRKRAFAAMRQLIANLSRRVRLVLFIDDLQWGDVDSVALLREVLRGPDAPRVLLVIAHRSEQSDANPCLRAMAETAKLACAPGHELELDVGSLDLQDARELARALLGDAGDDDALDWVVAQAAGSAFLIHELARHVVGGGARAAADGLGLDDILWKRVQALPDEPRALLSVLAAAGRPVRLRHVQRAAGLATLPPTFVSSLRAKRLARTDGVGLATEIMAFHDRVRESVVAHTPAADVTRHCASLARAIEAAGDGDAETLAALFEQAGELGLASGYYAAAVPRAVAALAFDRAELLAHKAIELARTDQELADAYEAAVHFHTDMARFPEAYALTRKGVGALGIELPEKFVPPLLIADFLATQLKLIGKPTASLLELPTMPEGRLRLAVRLANAGAKAAFQVRPELCVAVCTKIVRLCLEHGNSPDSAIGYMVFGAIFQGGILGRYGTGYELGRLALALVDKYQNERQRAEVSFVVGYFGTSWLRPATEAEALWRTAFEAGRATGDLFHMGCAAAGRMMSLHMRGAPLDALEREADELAELLARHGLRETQAVVAAVRQAARDLRGRTRAPGHWDDDGYDEAAETSAWSSFGARHFAHYCHLARAQSLYLRGQLDEAERALCEATRLAPDSKGMLHSAEQVLVQALVTAAQSESSAPLATRVRARLAVSRAARRLASWAERCPANFQAKAELVRAELERLAGREPAALAACARAATSAAEHGQVHVEGLAHRLAARLHASRGRHDEQQSALARADACFTRWGATALVSSVPSAS